MDASFVIKSGGGNFDNPYTYTERRFDTETGLYDYRNRFYHAQLGRFCSRDSNGYRGSPWNLYEYVDSYPVRFQAPTGAIASRVGF